MTKPSLPSEYPDKAEYKFILYVAGQEGNSQLARQNLKEICEEYFKGRFSVREVDVLADFETALREGIFVSPTLVLVSPEPKVNIIGNLGNKDKVLAALRIKA
jgi:circadian clock protein KaiB